MTDYVMVPREPTSEMLKAAAGITQKARMYRAMLAAAPQPQDRHEWQGIVFTLMGHAAELSAEGKRDMPAWFYSLAEKIARAHVDEEHAQRVRQVSAQQQAEPVAWALFNRHGVCRWYSPKFNDPATWADKDGAGFLASMDEGEPQDAPHRFVVLSASPCTTAEHVEQIKRLADAVEDALRSVVEAEYAAMGDPSLKYKRNELDEARAALHAALDALVKGE